LLRVAPRVRASAARATRRRRRRACSRWTAVASATPLAARRPWPPRCRRLHRCRRPCAARSAHFCGQDERPRMFCCHWLASKHRLIQWHGSRPSWQHTLCCLAARQAWSILCSNHWVAPQAAGCRAAQSGIEAGGPCAQGRAAHAARRAPRRQAPMCQLFAVDMAFCGGEGLITDRASALVVMACSPVRRTPPRAGARRGAGAAREDPRGCASAGDRFAQALMTATSEAACMQAGTAKTP